MLTRRSSALLVRLCRRILSLEWLILAFILPLVLFPTPARSLVLLVIPLLWLIRRIASGAFIPATPLDWPLSILLLMVLVSLYATFDIELSFPKIAGILFGVALYYAVVFAAGKDARRLWWGVGLFLAAGLAIGGLSLVTAQWSGKFSLLAEAVANMPAQLTILPGLGQRVNANEVAGVLLWVVPLQITLLVTAGRRFRQRRREEMPARFPIFVAGLVLLTLFLTGLLIMTQSRSGLIGLAAGLLFMLSVELWRWRRGVIATLILLAILGAVIVGMAAPEATLEWLSSPAGAEAGTSVVNTLEGRIEIWSRALYGIQDFPLTGMGLNTFRRVVHILYPLFLISPDVDIAHAHNHLLQTALGLGLPGLIAYIAVWLAMAGMLWQTWRQVEGAWLRSLTLGLAASLLAYFVFGMTDAVALGARPGFLFWLLLGLGASLHHLVVGNGWRRPRG